MTPFFMRYPKALFFFYFFLSSVFALLVCISTLVASQRESGVFPENLSSGKIFLFVAAVGLISSLMTAAFYFLLKPDLAERISITLCREIGYRNALLRIGAFCFLVCWIGFFFPSYLILHSVAGYFLQIKPFLLWGGLHFGSLMAVVHIIGSDKKIAPSSTSSGKGKPRIAFISFFVFLFISLFIVVTGFGISFREDYWYGAGVPILWFQIIFSLLIGIVFSWFANRVQLFKHGPRIDVVIFLLLWLTAAYFWGSEPLRPSYFMPDTSFNSIYPYSDSATFDLGSQYALIGQGLFNGQYFDRSLYSALLTYFHAAAGQKTENLMIFQAGMFAVFPAILYLLGKELHGRVLGITISSVVICRGVNSILGASQIDLAGPKMILTDFPTAIGVSLIILFILKWVKTPGKISTVIWAGCSIGLTLLLRTHAIFLLPFIVLYLIIFFKNRKVFWVYGSIFLLLGMVFSTMSLDFQNQTKGVPMFYMYYSRIQEVLKARYGARDDSNSGILTPAEQSFSAARNHNRFDAASRSDLHICESKSCEIENHLFHNLVTSTVYLPTSFVFDDFRHTVREAAPYWQQDWVGDNVNAVNYLLLFINLFIIAIGIDAVWKKVGFAGFFPVLILVIYLISNSLAFTSGGRYIAPVDWIVCVYFVMGLLELCFWFLHSGGVDLRLEDEEREMGKISSDVSIVSFRNLFSTFVAVFMIGSLIPLTDSLFPRRYHQKTTQDILLTLTGTELLGRTNLTNTSIAQFLNTPNAKLTMGRLLYPRFYASDYGEPGLGYPYSALNYRRLVFMVAGPFGLNPDGVIFPTENSIPNLHASDVIVLGCTNGNFLDALAVFIISEPRQVLLRPSMALACPLPNP